MSALNDGKTAIASYLEDIRRFVPLELEEERRLARAYVAGDKAAGDRIVRAHLRFVVAEARRFCGRGVPLEDLIQEGNLGLVRAIVKYDADREKTESEGTVKFISYAKYWVKAMMLASIGEYGKPIKLGRNIRSQVARMRTLNARAEVRSGRRAHDEEVASVLGVESAEVERLREAEAINFRSLDKPAGSTDDESEQSTLYALIASEQPAADDVLAAKSDGAQLRRAVERIVSGLGSRDRKLFDERLMCEKEDQKTSKQVGLEMGVSRVRAQQLEDRLKANLRRQLQPFVE